MSQSQPQPASSTPDYTMGFSDEAMAAVLRNTAEVNAAHLLPHLRPGQRALDFGCGPGTVSAGLAKAIAPGILHGVDMEESQVEMARSVAAYYQRDNAVFHVGDAAHLPFADDYFDVAHGHNVLMHVPDTQAVLGEVMRVLKPGGIIACREMICASSFTYPDFGVIGKAWEMFEDLIATDDGHPQIGRELKGELAAAGFVNARISASFDTYSTPEDIAFIHEFANRWFLSPDVTETAIRYGAGTEDLSEAIRAAYDRWQDHPAALCALAFGEAVANKPQAAHT